MVTTPPLTAPPMVMPVVADDPANTDASSRSGRVEPSSACLSVVIEMSPAVALVPSHAVTMPFAAIAPLPVIVIPPGALNGVAAA